MNLDHEHLTTIAILRKKVITWRNITILVVFLSLLFSAISKMDSSHISNSIIDNNSIARIKIDGAIFIDEYRDNILHKIQTNQNIKAVLIKINSPGGDIFASENLYYKIKEISQTKSVVVLMESIAASGGYMVAMAADHIIARNGTITGSIGVIMQSGEVTNFAEKLGIKFLTYKSAPIKSAPSMFEKETIESKNAIEATINDSHNFFVSMIKENRKNKIKEENFSKIFDGRVFNGRQALKLGLIDAIGGENEAINYLIKKSKIKDPHIIDVNLKEKNKNLFSEIFQTDFIEQSIFNNFKIMAILQ